MCVCVCVCVCMDVLKFYWLKRQTDVQHLPETGTWIQNNFSKTCNEYSLTNMILPYNVASHRSWEGFLGGGGTFSCKNKKNMGKVQPLTLRVPLEASWGVAASLKYKLKINPL